MKLGEDLLSGSFRERPDRFLVSVQVSGKTYLTHLPKSGRLAPPLLLEAIRSRAATAGVLIRAYGCNVSSEEVRIESSLPVLLG